MPSALNPTRLELEQTLMELGIRPTSYRALMLLPLIYVAWADGKMESVEVDRIRRFAADRLHLTPETALVLDKWLKEAPSQAFVERGLRGLLGVALDEDFLEVDVDELPDLVLHAESIARATADAFDDPNAVTAEEEVALGEIARLLEVDGGFRLEARAGKSENTVSASGLSARSPKQNSRPLFSASSLGARAAPHPSRPSARQTAQSHALLLARQTAQPPALLLVRA
jgi:hypothetical protein